MSKIYPNTTVEWPNAEDAPNSERSKIEKAHVVLHGDRLTIRELDANTGRYNSVDVLTECTVKGSGTSTTVVGKSQFMRQIVGLEPDEAEVTITFDARQNQCLNC